jgi:transcriptional regulator with XRE-family HTH domain
MGVSQQAIADRLGLSRTTVTKILNRDPKYSASKTTRDKVFRIAEEMGYDFTTIRRPFKREYGRTEINAPCEINIILDGGEAFDHGNAVARNIGIGGALLVDMKVTKMALPLRKFTVQILFREIPELANLRAECQVVRIADSTDADKPEIGVKFTNTNEDDRKILRSYVEKKIQEERERLDLVRAQNKTNDAANSGGENK